MEITGWQSHAEKRLAERGISKEEAISYMDKSIGVLRRYRPPNEQNNYYSQNGVIGICIMDGLVCTAYSMKDLMPDTVKIVEVLSKWMK